VGPDEHLLQGILGVGRRSAQHLPRVREQAHAVAIVDRPERVIGPGAEERYQLIV
jgi:hypothetical protein